MADFCFQCNVDMMFGPGSDFDHLGDPGPGMSWLVLCEGCGPIGVDDRGWCASPDCPVHGDMPPERYEVYGSVWRWVGRRSGPIGWAYRLRDRLLGSPWDAGTIHYWRLNFRLLWESLISGVPIYITEDEWNSFDHGFIHVEGLEKYDASGEVTFSTGIEATGGHHQEPPQTGVVRQQDD